MARTPYRLTSLVVVRVWVVAFDERGDEVRRRAWLAGQLARVRNQRGEKDDARTDVDPALGQQLLQLLRQGAVALGGVEAHPELGPILLEPDAVEDGLHRLHGA